MTTRTRLSEPLVTLAARVIEGETEIDFGQGSDYQAELSLSWEGGWFHACLVVFSEPHTSYGGWYDAPETTWREQVDTFEAIKIKDIAAWLKAEWNFDLVAPAAS